MSLPIDNPLPEHLPYADARKTGMSQSRVPASNATYPKAVHVPQHGPHSPFIWVRRYIHGSSFVAAARKSPAPSPLTSRVGLDDAKRLCK
ncbi:hypothetical protein B0H11DRAFT_2238338 [Mycena galericulata]|nr:hypothetical protein B0H11DRAFT_2238338 [Mycena galericulata]